MVIPNASASKQTSRHSISGRVLQMLSALLAVLLSACVANPIQRYESFDFSHSQIINSTACLAVLQPSAIVWRHYPGGSLKLEQASRASVSRLESVLRNHLQQNARPYTLMPDALSSPAHRELIHRVADAVLARPDSPIGYSLKQLTETLDSGCEQAIAVVAQAHINDADDRLIEQDLMLLLFNASDGRLRLVVRQRIAGGSLSRLPSVWREQLTVMMGELG